MLCILKAFEMFPINIEAIVQFRGRRDLFFGGDLDSKFLACNKQRYFLLV